MFCVCCLIRFMNLCCTIGFGVVFCVCGLGLFLFLCVEVNCCVGATSWVVLWVVFVFFGLFGCGFGVLFLLCPWRYVGFFCKF